MLYLFLAVVLLIGIYFFLTKYRKSSTTTQGPYGLLHKQLQQSLLEGNQHLEPSNSRCGTGK
jgi:hypothetical protein